MGHLKFDNDDMSLAFQPETVHLLYTRTLQLVYRFRPALMLPNELHPLLPEGKKVRDPTEDGDRSLCICKERYEI